MVIVDTNRKLHIAIASGKGGTGKTLVATNLFHILMMRGIRLCLIDCDAEQPNSMIFFEKKRTSYNDVLQEIPAIDSSLCSFCGKCYEYCNYNAIFYLPESKIIKTLDDLCHSCGACLMACKNGAISPTKISVGAINKYKIRNECEIIEAKMHPGIYTPVPIIKKAINYSLDYNVAIYDSPPGTSCPFIHTVHKADYVILVTEPTPFGLSDLIQSVETLKILKKNFGVIINRADIGNNLTRAYLTKENIPLLLEIPYDKGIAKDYSSGILAFNKLKDIQDKLFMIFNKLFEENGISSNQR